jgi:hypothetical protein
LPGLPHFAAVLAVFGPLAPDHLSALTLVGSLYVIGYFGRLALRVIRSGLGASFDADEDELERRNGGFWLGLLGAVLGIILAATSTIPLVDQPVDLLDVASMLALGNLTGTAAAKVWPDGDERAAGDSHVLSHSLFWASVWLTAWVLGAGHTAPKPTSSKSSQAGRKSLPTACRPYHGPSAKRFHKKHPDRILLQCPRP